MKILLSLLLAVVTVFGLTLSAHATLIDMGDGTIKQIRDDPTYGDGSTLMWLQEADLFNFGDWYDAMDWIAGLNSSNYLGYNDWRLPKTLPINGTTYDYALSLDGSTDFGYNITSPNSEMSYMFYVELGNLGYYDTSGSSPQPGWGTNEKSFFADLRDGLHFSATEYAPDTSKAWYFYFGWGATGSVSKDGDYRAWAVRDVSTPVPEPGTGTIFLLGSGLAGMVVLCRRRRKNRPIL